MRTIPTLSVFFQGLLVLYASTPSLGCSRVTYKARTDDRITVGRSMDFVASTNASFYALPAGLERDGKVDANPLNWTSKYGSVTNLMYNKIYTDGMNTEGLTASLLYLDGSNYGNRNVSQPGLFIGIWLQYCLDMYATVAELADDVCPGSGKEEKYQVVTKQVIPNVNSVGHLSVSDKSGDNLVMEYIDGKLNCYHSKDYNVMTNEPAYDQQIAIETYWQQISNYSLPGTSRPADRFARLAYYNTHIPEASDLDTAVSYTAGMIRAVSVPIVPDEMIKASGTADVWPTLWRQYNDVKDMVSFYESATDPMLFWFFFADLDLSKTGKTMVLDVYGVPWQNRTGDMKGQFVESASGAP